VEADGNWTFSNSQPTIMQRAFIWEFRVDKFYGVEIRGVEWVIAVHITNTSNETKYAL
jgi:hypothetical protein